MKGSLDSLRSRVPESQGLGKRHLIEKCIAYIDRLKWQVSVLEMEYYMVRKDRDSLLSQVSQAPFSVSSGAPGTTSERAVVGPSGRLHGPQQVSTGLFERMHVLYSCIDPQEQRIQIMGPADLSSLVIEIRCKERHGILYEAMDAIKALSAVKINKYIQEYDGDTSINIFLLDSVNGIEKQAVQRLGEKLSQV
mmetsp:Transcript_12601/g.46026  ORF Transcript_12601/g.46026 Transcript_12601/m.46026 type:complete len:193 (-) Transcript_12601:1184-1762(-)